MFYNRKFAKMDVLKEFLLLLWGGISLLLISSVESILIHIITMWFTTALAIIFCNFQILHPYFWFSISFSLYNSAYPILSLLGYDHYGYTTENMLLSQIALVVTLIIITPQVVNVTEYPKNEIQINLSITKKAVAFFAIIGLLCAIIIHLKGYANKTQLAASGDISYRIGAYAVRYLCMFLLFYMTTILGKKEDIDLRIVIVSFVASLLFMLYTGERDALFRYLMIVALVLFAYNRIKAKTIIILVPLAMIVMILSVYFRNYFTSGIINSEYTDSNNFLVMFLNTDFSAASSNLQFLLNKEGTMGSQGFKLIITELLSPFLPSGILFSPDHWFNYEVHTGGYHGYAFTLVGTGYIISGRIGVVVLFIIVGFICKMLYRLSTKNLYTMSCYIYMITTIIASFRQSLTTLVSPIMRIVLLSILASWIFAQDQLFHKNYHSKSN